MKNQNNLQTLYEAILIFLMVAIGYSYFSTDRDANINSRLALVKAFVDEDRFEIDSYHNTEFYTVDKAYFNGHYYSDKAIGTSVLGVIAYYPVRWIYFHEDIRLPPRLFREWLTFLAISLPTALLGPFLYILLKKISNNTNKSLFITLGVCFGTPLYKYSTAFYGHSLAAMLYLVAFTIWFHVRDRQSISIPLVFSSAFILGFMVITEYPTAIIAILLCLYILYKLFQINQLSNWKIYITFGIGFMIPICLLLYYNNSIFGSALATGYSYEANETFREAHSSSFMGIGIPDMRVFIYQTFHPSMGIFWQSPLLFLALIGWFFIAKKKEYCAETYFSIITIGLYILLISGYYMWWGGIAFSPRHLIPILPLFALPLAFIPARYTIILLITGLISISQNFVVAASGFAGLVEYFDTLLEGKYIIENASMLIYQVCLPNVLNGNLTNNRGQDLLGLQGLSSLLPLVIIEIGLLATYFKIVQFKGGGVRDYEN